MATPFRIRQRIKSALGLGAPSKKPEPQPMIELVVVGPGDRRQQGKAPLGQTVLLSAGNLASPIASGCSDSTCSTCRIEVLSGEDMLTPRSDIEDATLKANQRDPNLRLACVAAVTSRGSGRLEVRAHEFLE